MNTLEKQTGLKETGYGNIVNQCNMLTVTVNTAMGKHYREKHGDIIIPEQPFKVAIKVKRRCKDYVER
jgi:hypothetical protein